MEGDKNKRIDELRLRELQAKPGFDRLRADCIRRGDKPTTYPCLICGHPMDVFTIQCDGCGYIYLENEKVAAEGVGAMRRNGATEAEIAATARVMYGWTFDNPELAKRLGGDMGHQHLTPLLQTVFAQPASGEKS